MGARNDKLQALCREYLERLRSLAARHGLGAWIDSTIGANLRNECAATQDEVEALSRLVDDERLTRQEIGKELNISYRKCVESEVFEHIKKLRYVGTYSKIDTLLYKENEAEHNKNDQ